MKKISSPAKYQFNRERLLLTLLVALAFFGFLLWSIEASSQEEITLLSAITESRNQAANKIIKMVSPKVNATIKSPVLISGQALAFEGALQIRIKDASGLVLSQKQITVRKNSPFSASLTYKKPTRAKGLIEIFTRSPKDGFEANKLTLPVIFQN